MTRFFRLLLLLVVVTFVMVGIVSCDDMPATSANASGDTQSSPADLASSSEGDKPYVPNTTLKVDDTIPVPDTQTPPALAYTEGIVPEDGRVVLDSNSYVSGTLLAIDKYHPFRFNALKLPVSRDLAASRDSIPAHNLMLLYGNKSRDYLLSTSNLFVKKDAFSYLEDMMAAFASQTGENFIQMVNGYVFSDASGLGSAFVTGYSIAINVYDGNGTYSLNNKKVTVDGKTVTCLEWFMENCSAYGFIYTGHIGTEARALASFRFVGIPHSLLMEKNDILDLVRYSNFVQMAHGPVRVVNAVDQIEWIVAYYPAEQVLSSTTIKLPAGAKYFVSGDNLAGFIVAYHQ